MHIRFRGKYELRVDDKSRLAVPASFRQALEAAGEKQLVVVKAPVAAAQYLQLWPLTRWMELETELETLARSDEAVGALLAYMTKNCVEVEPDSHGRVVLPAALRAHAGIAPGGEAVAHGFVSRINLWSQENWLAHEAALDAQRPAFGAELARLGLL